MGLAAIAAVLIAASPDAGTPDAGSWVDDPIYAECPAAPQPQQLGDGSYLLSPLRAARNSCLIGACEDHRERLLKGPPAIGWFTWAVAALAAALAIVGGFYLGFEFRSLFPKG